MASIPVTVRKQFNDTEKLLYILSQGAPRMENSKFGYQIERVLGCSQLPEWHVLLTHGLGKNKHVVYEEVFKTKHEAEVWAKQFIKQH